MDWPALRLSLRLAGCTTIILLILGTPLAYWLAVTRRKWKFIVEAVVALPLVLPPTVLGFYLLMATGPRSLLGKTYQNVFSGTLPFSFQGILLASILYSLPFAVQPLASAFSGVDRRWVEASWCLGVSRIATFFRVILPLSLSGVVTAVVLCFAHTLGEFGVVLMVGGNLPGATRTLSIAIYDDVQALNYESAARASLLLLTISFLTLLVTYSLRKKAGGLWPMN